MIVVADTTPVNYLVLLGHIEVLPALYGRVMIPESVRDELVHARTRIRPPMDEQAAFLGGCTVTACKLAP